MKRVEEEREERWSESATRVRAATDLEHDRRARTRKGEGRTLDKDLHAAAEAQDQVERRLLLDVVVREGAAVLELLAGKDEALLVGRDALLVLDLGLDLLRVRGESARELEKGVRGE